MATANIIPTALTDGIAYATGVPVTFQEAALGDALVCPAIIPVVEGQTIVAVVKLTVSGFVTGNNTWVFMQTDLGDGTWIDVAWVFWNDTQGTATFVICGGGLGAMNNAFRQSRANNAAPTPQANGSNAVPLGGRVRFTGYSRGTGGSSNAAGVTSSVSATITYKLQNPR